MLSPTTPARLLLEPSQQTLVCSLLCLASSQAAAELVEGDASVLGLSESAEVAVDHSRRSVGEGYEALKHTQVGSIFPLLLFLFFVH